MALAALRMTALAEFFLNLFSPAGAALKGGATVNAFS
jgi:hypothetical protein